VLQRQLGDRGHVCEQLAQGWRRHTACYSVSLVTEEHVCEQLAQGWRRHTACYSVSLVTEERVSVNNLPKVRGDTQRATASAW